MTLASHAAHLDLALNAIGTPLDVDRHAAVARVGYATPRGLDPSTSPATPAAARLETWLAADDRNRTAYDDLVAANTAGTLNDFTSSLHSFVTRRGYLTDPQRDALLRGIAKRANRPERPARTGAEPAEEGVYERDDVVYVVKRARESGNLYAKRIVEIGGERLTEAGTVINAEFEYAPGVIRALSAEDKMTFERAKALTIRYGFCVACGRHLKAAKSVTDGIGPICRKKFA